MATISVTEAVLARAKAVLAAAATDAATRVHRGRVDAFAAEEIPALNLLRSEGQCDAIGSSVDRLRFEFDLEAHARGADWETSADRLHLQAHQALQSDAALAALCKGLRCVRTQPSADPGDQPIGRITATYQAQALVRVADLAAVA